MKNKKTDLQLEVKCNFCRWYEQIDQKKGYCRFNPPEKNGSDIIVKADRKGCHCLKFVAPYEEGISK